MSRAAATPTDPRRAIDVTLPEALLAEARELGVDLSQACERGLAAGVVAARRERWPSTNRTAFQSWNDHVDRHGLPLGAYRQS